jgi:hypothetical protein
MVAFPPSNWAPLSCASTVRRPGGVFRLRLPPATLGYSRREVGLSELRASSTSIPPRREGILRPGVAQRRSDYDLLLELTPATSSSATPTTGVHRRHRRWADNAAFVDVLLDLAHVARAVRRRRMAAPASHILRPCRVFQPSPAPFQHPIGHHPAGGCLPRMRVRGRCLGSRGWVHHEHLGDAMDR